MNSLIFCCGRKATAGIKPATGLTLSRGLLEPLARRVPNTRFHLRRHFRQHPRQIPTGRLRCSRREIRRMYGNAHAAPPTRGRLAHWRLRNTYDVTPCQDSASRGVTVMSGYLRGLPALPAIFGSTNPRGFTLCGQILCGQIRTRQGRSFLPGRQKIRRSMHVHIEGGTGHAN